MAPVVLACLQGLTLLPAYSTVESTFRCTDRNGTSVFTDSPSQLENCTAVNRVGSAGASAPEPQAAPSPTPDAEIRPLADQRLETVPVAVQPGGQVTVPVQRAGHSLTVHAMLNGTHQARLIVDTGADITILSHKLALDLGITPTASSPTVTLNTAGGTVRADVARLATLAVGGAEVHNVSVVVHTLPDAPPEVDGLLGLTFLDKFLVTLDAQKGELHLKKRD